MEGPMMGGYLSVPSQKAIKKIWSRRYFLLYPTSGSGVVRLLQFESQDQAKKGPKGAKIIPLKDCVAITPSAEHKSQPNVIDIVFPDKTLSFATESEKLLNNWYLKLCKAVFGGNSPNVADSSAAAPPPYSPPQIPSSQPPPYRATEPPEGATAQEYSGMADNVIYAAQESLSYQVVVRLTEAAQRCDLDGPYLLQVNPTHLSLQDRRTNEELYTWPYKYLRRYGRDKTQFSLEAGRKCASGEGKFEFATTEGNSIFNNVDAFVKGRASIAMDAPSQRRKDSGETLKRDPTLPPRNYTRPQSTGPPEMPQRPARPPAPRPTSDGSSYQQVNKPVVAVKPRLSQKAEEPESDLYEPLGDYYAEVDDVKPAVEPEYSEAEMRMQAWKQQGRSVKEKELASATFDPNTEDYHVPAVPSKSKPPPVAPRAKKRVDHIYDAPPAIGEDSEDYTEPTEMHSDRPPGFEDDEGVYEDTEALTKPPGKPAKKPPAPPPPVPRHAPKARKPVVESPYEEPPREIMGMIAKFNKMQSGDDGSYDSLNFSPEGKKNKPVVAGDGEYGALYSTVPSNYQDEPDETYDRLENAISGTSFKDSEGPVYHVLEGPYSPVGTTEKHIYDEVPTEQFQPN
ncbi:uncharacterized protein LOC144869645 isoform X1 [Branchiostoma floridae x Branchiostoma japonicum]